MNRGSGRADCEACRLVHDDKPPCHECPEADEGLRPENRLAWEIWQVLDRHGRPPGPLVPAEEKGKQRFHTRPLDITAALALAEALDATREDLDKVLQIETIIYPSLNEA